MFGGVSSSVTISIVPNFLSLIQDHEACEFPFGVPLPVGLGEPVNCRGAGDLMRHRFRRFPRGSPPLLGGDERDGFRPPVVLASVALILASSTI